MYLKEIQENNSGYLGLLENNVRDKMQEHLIKGYDWEKLKNLIPNINVVKVPATKKRPPVLYLEVIPSKLDGKPMKKNGLFIRYKKELEKFKNTLNNDIVLNIINEIDKVNKQNFNFENGKDKKREIKTTKNKVKEKRAIK